MQDHALCVKVHTINIVTKTSLDARENLKIKDASLSSLSNNKL